MSICLSFLWLSCNLIWIFVEEPKSLSFHQAVTCVAPRLGPVFVQSVWLLQRSLLALTKLWTLCASCTHLALFHLRPPGDPRRMDACSSYNIVQPHQAVCGPCSSHSGPRLDMDSCLLDHFHVMPARQTNTPRRPLQMTKQQHKFVFVKHGSTCHHRTRSSYSMHFFLFSNHKSLARSQCLYESLVIWLLRHEHMREQVPMKWKSGEVFRSVEGNAEEPLCCRVQITSIWHKGRWRAEAAPCEEPTGNTLPATWQWHLDILFFAPLRGKNWTCLVITGVLMLAVLSEDAVLCHYCAPVLIIDSIKMAVKLDVPISSGACCLF